MKVTLLHTSGCHIWKTALEELEVALAKTGNRISYEVVQVTSQAQAEKLKFTGSPTILINGKNVDKMKRKINRFTNSGCSIYFWKGKTYEYPPKEMITAAIKENKKNK